MFVDTHAHIYVKEFENDLDTTLTHAQSNGVSHIFMPNIDESSMPHMLGVASRYPFCYPMIGLHPCHVFADYKTVIKNIWKYYDQYKFFGIGEIGIDLYWDKSCSKEQTEAFRWQISFAKEAKLPFVIHSRDALDLTISTVEELQDGSLRGIFHCFGGDLRQANRIIDTGFLLGIGGVLSYKKSGLDTIISEIPLSQIVLETDAPYLSPVPYRGKRNEPGHIIHIAQKLSELKNITLEEVASITTTNAKTLFCI